MELLIAFYVLGLFLGLLGGLEWAVSRIARRLLAGSPAKRRRMAR